MNTTPYRIVVVSQISAPPTNEQFNWMTRTLRMLVKSARNLGMEGECIHLLIYPMSKQWREELPPWARSWTRPEGCHIDVLNVPRYAVWGCPGVDPWSVISECRSMRSAADEVWCLNALGHGHFGNSAPCKVWREAQSAGRPDLGRLFKLVPSWVNSDEPVRPATKEKRNAKRAIPDKAAPARKAGDFTRRDAGSGKGKGRRSDYW